MAPPLSVPRRIDFFKIARENPGPFDAAKALGALAQLLTKASRYYDDPTGPRLCCWVDKVSLPGRLRVAHLRADGWPIVEQKGEVSGLDLPAGSHLAETTHATLFQPKANLAVIACEYNHFGPRGARIAKYIRAKLPGECGDIVFMPLLRADAAKTLEGFSGVSIIDLKVRRAELDALKAADSRKTMWENLDSAAEVGGAQDVSLVLRAGRGKVLKPGILAWLKSLVHLPEATDLSRLKVRGTSSKTHQPEWVDMLSEYLVSRKNVVKLEGKTRAIDSGSMYTAIESSFGEMKDTILSAATIIDA